MASSRLEKIGTIYSRTSGLIKTKALKWNDRPVWYDVYEAFPPFDEPRYDRAAPEVPIRKIFYHEDKPRALFHKNNKQIGSVNMLSSSKTLTQKFINLYQKIDERYDGSKSQEEVYVEAVEMLHRDRLKQTVEEDAQVSLSAAFKNAQSGATLKDTAKINIKINDIFKK